MRKFKELLFSNKLGLYIMGVLAVSVGIATFVENSFDTQTAKQWIYSARWMEFLLLLLLINLTGAIIKEKLYKRTKWPVFLFHLGFVFMIIGAALTRYVGYEGTMHIREGESSNEIFIAEPHIRIGTSQNYSNDFTDIEMNRKIAKKMPFTKEIEYQGKKGKVKLIFKKFYKNVREQLVENVADGTDMLKYRVASKTKNIQEVVKKGELKKSGGITFNFTESPSDSAVNLKREKGKFWLSSTVDIYKTKHGTEIQDTIPAGKQAEISLNDVYTINKQLFMFTQKLVSAKYRYTEGMSGEAKPDMVIADLVYKDQTKEIKIFGGDGYYAQMKPFDVDDLTIHIGYGSVPHKLAFSIYLEDFILERYPGSKSPSSFESDVILIDEREGIRKKYKIFMNNILDYDGYRFFQSSYDKDEKGTVLSVNNDSLGTNVTYLSYIMFTLGFILMFFAKDSRTRTLMKKIKKSRKSSKAVIIAAFLLLSASSLSAQSNKPVGKEHADKFGHLIVQTYDGRFQPVHTLAYDVTHKITKKNKLKTPEKGSLNAMQFFFDLLIDKEYWKSQKIIYVKEETIRNLIGTSGKYASYHDFFNSAGRFKLADVSETAYRKSKTEQTSFDKEIIKVNERLNILLMTFRSGMLKIFPDQNDENHKWVTPNDSAAFVRLNGPVAAINEDLGLDNFTYNSLFNKYSQTVKEAVNTGDYNRAEQLLGYLSKVQKYSSADDILPSETKINLEVHYNKAQIFVFLKYVYMILSVIMLALAFIEHLSSKKNKTISLLLKGTFALSFLAFLYHTYGLGLRWYLSGHAPWSNGYEVLIFVAWGVILAGFIFMKYSKITMAATVLFAFLITMTAGFSSYDPQLTNLQPVLKSYWLIIHVAVIVISYSFLGLGFILGFMNLVLYAVQNNKNKNSLLVTIKNLTNINEMNLTIGIVLATIGTFLGAVWANESWGRYWGWDAKETWALIILLVYAIVLHLRLVPKLNNTLALNIGSVLAFSTVIMTFFGVNYYFTKGMHSYASGETKAGFPIWAWIALFVTATLIFLAWRKFKAAPANDAKKLDENESFKE